MDKKLSSKKICKFIFQLTTVLAAELFVFNYRHWESLGNREIPVEVLEGEALEVGEALDDGEALDGTVSLGSGYQLKGDHTYQVIDSDLAIILEGIGEELKTSCIKIRILNSQDSARKKSSKIQERPVVIHQAVTDESHALYYELPVRELWAEEERSSYMTYHLYGKCGNLKITPELPQGVQVSISISLNPTIPLFFSWERILTLLFFSGLILLLKPSSGLHRLTYLGMGEEKKGYPGRLLLLSFFAIHGLLFFCLSSLNPYFQQEVGENQKQYQKLAQSLKAGSFSIMEEVPETLKSMENPYDYARRNQLMEENGEWYQWDYAYYEGKYYVYFGVVPVMLFYLPFYLITGKHLSNHIVIFLLSLFFLAGVLGVVHELIRKWFPKISLACWFLITELILTGSNIIYMTKRPDLYTVPILAGLSFGLLGLWCILRSVREPGFSWGYVALGSLLTAGIAGCRPQLFVFILPVMGLLGEHALYYSQNGSLKRDGFLKLFLSFAIPMVLAAAFLMYYNYRRFGSVFDFGANYNLTFNDMRRRGFELDRIPLGMFAYLLQPVKVIQQFPFVEAVYFNSQYMGVTIQEATYGGLLRTNFFAWFSLLPILISRQLRKYNKAAWKMAVLLLVGAVAVIVVDTNMSGILMRYFSDFSIFFMLAAAVSAMALLEHSGQMANFSRRGMIWMLLFCLMGELFYQGAIFFLDTGEALRDLRPDLYSHMKYLAAFWL